jgi:hypothetical protein
MTAFLQVMAIALTYGLRPVRERDAMTALYHIFLSLISFSYQLWYCLQSEYIKDRNDLSRIYVSDSFIDNPSSKFENW